MHMLVPLLLALLSAALGVGLFVTLRDVRRERERADELAGALADARIGRAEAEARLRGLEVMREESERSFRALSADVLAKAQDELIKRAEEQAKARDQLASAELEKHLKPVAETLQKFEQKIEAVEKARAEDSGGLKAEIKALMDASQATQAEARKLSSALRRGAGVQGRWGEETLRNVLEMSGLSARFDFVEQLSRDTAEGRLRPDVVVRLPGGGVFVVDSKCSLNAYLEAMEAADDAARDGALVRHAASLRTHMQGLSAKAYWDQFKTEGSPDFVAMFVPGDAFLTAALERAPDLMSEAMDRRVIIVTPTTLFALCKAVAYGWRVDEQSRNADQIAEIGRELYKRLSTMGGHVSDLGDGLKKAVEKYNAFVGSLESKVLTQAKRFEDFSADHQGRALASPEAIDAAPRALSKLKAQEPPDA
jgi:DNA recombination protein RmuC